MERLSRLKALLGASRVHHKISADASAEREQADCVCDVVAKGSSTSPEVGDEQPLPCKPVLPFTQSKGMARSRSRDGGFNTPKLLSARTSSRERAPSKASSAEGSPQTGEDSQPQHWLSAFFGSFASSSGRCSLLSASSAACGIASACTCDCKPKVKGSTAAPKPVQPQPEEDSPWEDELVLAPPIIVSGRMWAKPSSPSSGQDVWLHIYDVFGALERVNTFMKPVGSGAFHAGVEVFGKEWSYGYADQGAPGVYWCPPRCNCRHRYRESVSMGTTRLSEGEVLKLVLDLKNQWVGCNYDVLVQNCCHFCDVFCRRLGVGPTPEWLMHLAGAGAALASGVGKAHYHLAQKLLAWEVEVEDD